MPMIRRGIDEFGPIVDLTVWVGEFQAAAIVKTGQKVLPPISIQALIDTGADCSAIDDTWARTLGLNSNGTKAIQSSAQGTTAIEAPIYEVKFSFGSLKAATRPEWHEIQAVGVSLIARGCLALIGRDLLSTSLLIYDGLKGELIVSY